jgi:shikimate kinase
VKSTCGTAAAVTLIGPGGAGKTTAGILIAERLGIAFADLDRWFECRAGGISEYIEQFGYHAYARGNVEAYRSLINDGGAHCVAALSSGFMTYPRDVHPEYARLRRDIDRSPTTFVLLPSVEVNRCVAETVRRQLTRSFARSAEREESVIRERFAIYLGLRARKIETMRPVAAIVDEVVSAVV